MRHTATLALASLLLAVAAKPGQAQPTTLPDSSGYVSVASFYQLLGGLRDAGWNREHMSRNRLAILPDLTHYEVFASPALAATVLPFLNGRSGAKSWAEQVKERRPERNQ